MITISLKADFRPVERAFNRFQQKQIPFARALALTRLAQGVQAAERQAISETFDNPTPFTLNGIVVKPATKTRPVAIVYARDIAGAYLAPYVNGGDRSLGKKKGMLVPRDVPLNQYGNLSAGTLARLKAKPGVFIGPVKTKSGKVINGVWQRPTSAKIGKRGKILKQGGPLKLLIQFADTTPVQKHLPFYERARAYLKRNARREFAAAMRQALATA